MMDRATRIHSLTFFLLFLLIGLSGSVTAEEEAEPVIQLRTEQLVEIQSALVVAEDELKVIKKSAGKTTQEKDPDLFETLSKQTEEVERLRSSLEKIATGGLTISAINAEDPPFEWQKEIISITQPLIESLKTLTKNPRQTAELRTTLERIEAQQQLLQKGIIAIERENTQTESAPLKASLTAMQQEWQQQIVGLTRDQGVISAQLQSMSDNQLSWQTSLGQLFEGFFEGRSLTLFMAIVLAIVVWLLFRLLNRRVWHHQSTRRSSPLYRFMMYAFHAFSTIFIVLVVFTVFYLRDDVLLLGLGVIVLIGGIISLQRALPRFLKEVNLLLNLGSARESERVMYNGVPYLVQSLNVFTTLSNPTLSGIHRLPLEQMASLFSRPVLADESWFPSHRGDVLLMPDNTLVVVEQQNIEQVILKLRGGALIHYNTASFFELNLTNLSRSGNFDVSTVFGLDYRYQDKILDEYPTLIKAEIPGALKAAGIDSSLYRNVAVEFKTANASSLDLQIWVTFDSQLAPNFKRLERILQQACVRVCNAHNLVIPFPQLSVHIENDAD